jgi:c-di-GMP-binding flagellar brake protein YcgR
MSLDNFLQKIGLRRQKQPEETFFQPHQNVRVRMDISPKMFTTRVEDIDDEHIYISGISDQELNFSVPLPKQRIELFVFKDNNLYQSEALFKHKVNQPLYLWVLEKPSKSKLVQERRKTFRLDNVVDADFQVLSKVFSSKERGVTQNVSMGGIALVSAVNIPLKTRIEVKLHAIQNVALQGDIVWRYARPFLDKWYYGVKFVDVDDRVRAVLAHYINQRLANLKWLEV